MPCNPYHPPPGPRADLDSHDALHIAMSTLGDLRAASPWGDPCQQIGLLSSLILEARSQLTLAIEHAIQDGYDWNRIRDHLGLPHPHPHP